MIYRFLTLITLFSLLLSCNTDQLVVEDVGEKLAIDSSRTEYVEVDSIKKAVFEKEQAITNPKQQQKQNPLIVEHPTQKMDWEVYQPKATVVEINPKEDAVFKTASGVEWIIPAYSFNADQPVTFSVREYVNPTTTIKSNLTTLTKDGEILESGGMYELKAFCDGQKIELDKGAEIILKLPESTAEGMEIYYGEKDSENNIVWELDPYGTTLKPVVLMQKYRFNDVLKSVEITPYKLDKPTLMKLLDQTWTMNMSFDAQGYCIGGECYGENSRMESHITDPVRRATYVFKEMLPYLNKNLFKSNSQSWDVDYVFKCMDQQEYRKIRKEQLMNSAVDQAMRNFEKRSASGRKYFSIGRLGNVNIDRDIPLPALTPRTDIFVKANSGEASVKLVLVGSNTVVPAFKNGNQYHFKNIPTNKEVKILSSYLQNSKVYLGYQQLEVRKNLAVVELDYEEVAMNKLDSRIAQVLEEE